MTRKILIADDSRTDAAIISSILSDYELLLANDGVEALERIEQNPNIDILILDINMPRMNGFEVLRRLQVSRPALRILVLSMYAEEQYALRMLREGAAGETLPADKLPRGETAAELEKLL